MKTDTLEKFDEYLKNRGCGYAPNGARYLLTHDEQDHPICERTLNGNRERIVGYNNSRFECIDQVRYWARMDGRYEIVPGAFTPIGARKQIV